MKKNYEKTFWDIKVQRALALLVMANGNKEKAYHWGGNDNISDAQWYDAEKLYLRRIKKESNLKNEKN